MRAIVVSWWLLVSTLPAYCGPWQRESGQWFIASGTNLFLSDGSELPVHYDPTAYVEYGLTPLVTVGVDYHTADRGRIHTGFVFASFPLLDNTGRDRLAASLAYGARVDAYHPAETLMRGGVAWGRGLDTGWLTIEATATYGTIDTMFRPKVDMTWGYNINDRWTTIVQVQTGQGYGEDYYAKTVASVSYAITESHRVNLGWVQGITGDRGAALKLDLWSTY